MLAIPEDFLATFSHNPPELCARELSHASKARCDLKAMTGRSRLVILVAGERLTVRLLAAGLGLGRRAAGLALQRRDPCLQRFVLLARKARHVLDRLELLALDHVEVAQDLFDLVAPERVDLALDALGCARGVVHQPSDLV